MEDYRRKENTKDYRPDEIENLRVYGRTTECISPLALFWTGSGIEMNVRAAELWIEVEADFSDYEPWISITVDGAVVARQMLMKGRYWLPVIRMMDREPVRNIRILRETQAMSGDASCMLLIHSIRIDGEFCPLKPKDGRIEFIGDSLTSGEGTIGALNELNWNSMVFSAVNNYAVLTAEALNLDYHIVSQSGWGTLSSWDGNPACNVPAFYDQVCGLLSGEQNRKLGAFEPYHFEAWQPDVVVIALGTNDASAFNQPAQFIDPVTGELFDQKKNEDGSYDTESLKRLEHAMMNFLIKARHHNPDAHIIWIYNMMDAALNDVVVDVVQQYRDKAGDLNVNALRLPIVTPETTGSREHPGVKSHRLFADTLIPEVKKYLKS